MNTERILKIDLTPFCENVISRYTERNGFSEETRKIHLVLFLLYLKEFSREHGINLSIPEYYFSPVYDNQMPYVRDKKRTWDYNVTLGKVMKEILQQVMRECGWETARYLGKELVEKDSSFSQDIGKKELKKRYLTAKKHILLDDRDELYGLFLFWNKRVYSFKRFTETHTELVNSRFAREKDRIYLLLDMISNTMDEGIDTAMHKKWKHDFQIIFWEGRKGGSYHDYWKINYNFFIRIITLELLLVEAEKEFGYLQEKEDFV